jgi:hypothetical protein
MNSNPFDMRFGFEALHKSCPKELLITPMKHISTWICLILNGIIQIYRNIKVHRKLGRTQINLFNGFAFSLL